MAWQPGESGNPDGSKKQRLFLKTLERAIKLEDGKRLRGAVEKLLDYAEAGEPWAIKELADRLDGKPKQQIEAMDDTGRTIAIAVIAYDPNNHTSQVSAPALPAPGVESDRLRH